MSEGIALSKNRKLQTIFIYVLFLVLAKLEKTRCKKILIKALNAFLNACPAKSCPASTRPAVLAHAISKDHKQN